MVATSIGHNLHVVIIDNGVVTFGVSRRTRNDDVVLAEEVELAEAVIALVVVPSVGVGSDLVDRGLPVPVGINSVELGPQVPCHILVGDAVSLVIDAPGILLGVRVPVLHAVVAVLFDVRDGVLQLGAVFLCNHNISVRVLYFEGVVRSLHEGADLSEGEQVSALGNDLISPSNVVAFGTLGIAFHEQLQHVAAHESDILVEGIEEGLCRCFQFAAVT